MLHIKSYAFDCFTGILGGIKIKFSQILMQLMTKFLTRFYLYCEDYSLVPSSNMILIKWQNAEALV